MTAAETPLVNLNAARSTLVNLNAARSTSVNLNAARSTLVNLNAARNTSVNLNAARNIPTDPPWLHDAVVIGNRPINAPPTETDSPQAKGWSSMRGGLLAAATNRQQHLAGIRRWA